VQLVLEGIGQSSAGSTGLLALVSSGMLRFRINIKIYNEMGWQVLYYILKQ
jgi:hypothetical protein